MNYALEKFAKGELTECVVTCRQTDRVAFPIIFSPKFFHSTAVTLQLRYD